jgi:hypothetical protein
MDGHYWPGEFIGSQIEIFHQDNQTFIRQRTLFHSSAQFHLFPDNLLSLGSTDMYAYFVLNLFLSQI